MARRQLDGELAARGANGDGGGGVASDQVAWDAPQVGRIPGRSAFARNQGRAAVSWADFRRQHTDGVRERGEEGEMLAVAIS